MELTRRDTVPAAFEKNTGWKELIPETEGTEDASGHEQETDAAETDAAEADESEGDIVEAGASETDAAEADVVEAGASEVDSRETTAGKGEEKDAGDL